MDKLDWHRDPELIRSAARFRALAPRINQAMALVRQGHLDKVESPIRLKKYAEREQLHLRAVQLGKRPSSKLTELGNERGLGISKDLLSIEFFEQGLLAARSVGRIVVMETEYGTGFLVGYDLLMTNHHVIHDETEARGSRLEMDYETNRVGTAKVTESFELDPDRFFLTLKDLDMTLVAVRSTSDNARPLSEYGALPLIVAEGKIRIGDPVNLIQHPDGREKMVVVHDSQFLHLENGVPDSELCWYSSDTEPGSSGAPVFNNRWEVVALHHKAVMKMNENRELLDRDGNVIPESLAKQNPSLIVWIANEGVRISHIVSEIGKSSVDPKFESQRQELLDYWKRAANPANIASNPARVASSASGHESTASGKPTVRITHGETATPQVTIHISFGN